MVAVNFAIIHSSQFTVEQILNRPITNFDNSDNVDISAAELLLTKTRPVSFFITPSLLYETKMTDLKELKKPLGKIRSFLWLTGNWDSDIYIAEMLQWLLVKHFYQH